MVKLSADVIVERLEAHGLVHRTVQMQTEGEYLAADVDWNNKDVPHLNHLHTLVNDVTCVVERDLQASISLQKVLGISYPLILVHYDIAPMHQTHFVTLGAWSIITNHEFVELSPTRTRAITTYTVCGTRFWMLFWPVIKRIIQRNYRRLMSEDVPMRLRRGQLRSWGYRFKGDETVPRDIRASLNIHANNLLAPDPPLDAPDIAPIPLVRVHEGEWTFVGRDDHLGLMLTREGHQLKAYRRTCPHEGAKLDGAPMDDGCHVCPWHGRELGPLATLDLDDATPSAETDWHELRVEDGAVHVTITNTGPARSHAASRASTNGTDG